MDSIRRKSFNALLTYIFDVCMIHMDPNPYLERVHDPCVFFSIYSMCA